MSDLVTGLGVHLKVASVAESRNFYEEFLELSPVFAYGSEEFLATIPQGVPTAPERYQGVTYEVPGGAKIEIADGHIAVRDSDVFRDRIVSPKVSAMIQVTSLVPLLQKGVFGPKGPLTKYYWGTIEMVVRDPDGWVIVLIAPFSEAEMKATSAIAEVRTVDVE